MAGIFTKFSNWVAEPPPELVYEISESGIAMARTANPVHVSFHAFAPGVIVPSPVQDNVGNAEALLAGIRDVTPAVTGRKRRTAALLLPDAAARVAVLDFDKFPDAVDEQQALVRFRMKKSVPYDIDSSAISYFVQPNRTSSVTRSVVAAVAPYEIVARYEAPFRGENLQPGLVTLSFLGALELVPATDEPVIVAKLSGRSLTLLVVRHGQLQLVRSLELAEANVGEISNELYPTMIYVEDNFAARPAELLLCGFGDLEREALSGLAASLGIPVRALAGPQAGLLGYLQSLQGGAKAANA